MIRSSLLLAIAASFALVAPAHAAKASISTAKKACVAAVKDLDDTKSARQSDDGMSVNNDFMFIPVRVTHNDGSKTRLICTFDRGTSGVTSLETEE